jgi:hypothetical protein
VAFLLARVFSFLVEFSLLKDGSDFRRKPEISTYGGPEDGIDIHLTVALV